MSHSVVNGQSVTIMAVTDGHGSEKYESSHSAIGIDGGQLAHELAAWHRAAVRAGHICKAEIHYGNSDGPINEADIGWD
ncbi:hypothetical protein [Paenibacillus pinihumi]|uniref:hypothetical protein n=1 Tax=Paenibacillus pinihumi TaxID=669462 RepID=UPI0012B5911C|nr:hypothetical protein [Paenibacillus pinihumi]